MQFEESERQSQRLTCAPAQKGRLTCAPGLDCLLHGLPPGFTEMSAMARSDNHSISPSRHSPFGNRGFPVSFLPSSADASTRKKDPTSRNHCRQTDLPEQVRSNRNLNLDVSNVNTVCS